MRKAAVAKTPEEQLLLLATAQFLGGVAGLPVADRAPDPGLDWNAVLRLGAIHRLLPLLARTPAGAHAPPPTRKALDDEARRMRIRVAVMVADFQALHAAFAAAGIPLLPIKGLALSYRHFPSPALRYHDDLDLLIPAAAAPAALPILQSLGYIPHPNSPVPEWHHLAPHVHPVHGTLVELHHDLVRRSGGGWPLADIWRRTIPLSIAGCETRTLGDPDTLVYGVLHARHSLFHRLQALLDLLLVLRSVKDEQEAARLAADAGAQEALAFMLHSSAELLLPVAPTLAPLFAYPLLRQGSPRRQRRLVRLVGWHSLQPGRRADYGPRARLVELQLQDSLPAALRLAWRLLRPPQAFVQESYGGGYGRRIWRRLSLLWRKRGRQKKDAPAGR